uniref:Centriolar coiled-coil protein 110 n=1 Tax=Oryzias latipes TaxID=8090 RepID=A0A3P9H4M9_ORYLA
MEETLSPDPEEARSAAAPSSVIRFHGLAILPPLLSEEQRQQMQARREEARGAAARMELKQRPRMSYVQTLLRSVQLRKTPTLEELLQESDVPTKCSPPPFPPPRSSSSESRSEASVRTERGLSPEKLESSSPSPLSPISASLTPEKQICCEGGVSGRVESPNPPELQSCCGGQLSSSGYLSHKSVEMSVSSVMDQQICTFNSSGEACGVGDGFLHSTSNTIAARPDIISHPPVDGEELERSGLECSVCGAASLYDHLPSEESGSVEQTDDGSFPAVLQSTDGDVDDGPVAPGGNPAETEPGDNLFHSERLCEEKPHPRSLKALLKKSQEYRRQQRMLRNQSRNANIQELLRTLAEEQSLSDKENDEHLCRNKRAADGNRTKERGGAPSVGTSQRPRENYEIIGSEITGNNTSTDTQSSPVTGSGDTSELHLVSKTILRNKLNTFQEFIIPADTSPPQDCLPGGAAFSKGAAKFCSVPAPSFCCSPSRFKDSCIKHLQPAEGAETSEEKRGVQFTTTSAGEEEEEEEVSGVSAQSSRHLEHLEVSLTGLKSLISCLESAVKESPEQTESSWRNRTGHNHCSGGDEEKGCISDVEGAALTVQEAGGPIRQASVGGSYTQRRDGRQQPPPPKCVLSAAPQTRIPCLFRNPLHWNAAPGGVSVLSGTSCRPAAGGGRPPTKSPPLNHSFDVEKPSGLWLLEGPGTHRESQCCVGQGAHLTPESGGEEQAGTSRVKRRLVMHVTEQTPERRTGWAGPVVRPTSSTPTAAAGWFEDKGADQQEQLKEVHAARLRALQEVHRQQQERLLQHLRPLLAAAVKGFLTRRLLRTERVAQLLRTIRDTQQFLQSFQQQSVARGAVCSRQDVVLQERVALQLRAARYELYDVFFSLSARERMQMIGWDRELAKEREVRRQKTGSCPGQTILSAATQKSLERKREAMIQRKVAERTGGFKTRTGPKLCDDKPQPRKQGQTRARLQRATKSAGSSKP